MDRSDDINSRIDKAARDVLMYSRNSLLVNLRFLDMAISRLEPVAVKGFAYATDGVHLGYGTKYVLKCFKSEPEMPVRDYLHIVLHCVFSHMFIGALVDKSIWDLACDIAVENTITDLGIRATTTSREGAQKTVIDKLKSEINMLTAEKVYHYYMEKGLSPVRLKQLRSMFMVDDHSCWYGDTDPFAAEAAGDGTSDSHRNPSGDGDEKGENSRSQTQTTPTKAELEEDWKSVAERIQQDLETFSKRQGNMAGGMMQNLNSVNRERYDYTSFLKKFAVLGEAMTINDEEFDYIFYTYGLKLYKNIPLIEPLEYKEVKRIKEFVIAIDTSGSTSGELVQRFVQKTYNILKSTESFFLKINVHIIQCDAEIQEHVKITSEEEFDEYLKTMKIHGLGGTDFRPVFSFVDNLVAAKEFSNLKGLIYFTDGYGMFPNYKPGYETAFVFLDNDYNNPEVPPWAIKLVLQDDEIK